MSQIVIFLTFELDTLKMTIHSKSTEFGISFYYCQGMPCRIEQSIKIYYITMLLFIFDAGVIQLQLYHPLVTQQKRKNMKNFAKLF